MNKPTLVLVFTALVSFFSIERTYAQLNLSKWQVGANAGIYVYQGDLTPSPIGSYRTLSPGFGISIARIISNSFLLRANINRANLKGTDGAYANPWWRKERNFTFSTPVTEVTVSAVWNIFRNTSGEDDRKFSPYVFVGGGVSLLRVSRDYSRMNTTVFDDGSEVVAGLATDMATPTPKVLPVVPLGLGVEYKLTRHIALTAETSFRLTNTDYLDGFSKSANPKKKDYYHSHTIGLVYKFGSSKEYDCPAVR